MQVFLLENVTADSHRHRTINIHVYLLSFLGVNIREFRLPSYLVDSLPQVGVWGDIRERLMCTFPTYFR